MSSEATAPEYSSDFQLAIEAAPAGMLMVDLDGKIVLINSQIEKLFGYKRHELIGQPVELLIPQRFRIGHPYHRAGFHRTPQARLMGAGRDLYGMRKDGSELPIEIGLNPLQTSAGHFVLSSVADISSRKQSEGEREQLMLRLRQLNQDLEGRVQQRTSELSAALREREALLQEVHHRVKNNLQVISSLISMQMRASGRVNSRDALEECLNRVQAIALIHELLYRAKDHSRVPFSQYAGAIASGVLDTASVSRELVDVELAIEPVALPADKAIPCGLILNELLTNALKHGFPNGQRGKISVELKRLQTGQLKLAVRDDGIGLPRDFNVERVASMGLQLVRTLTEQLHGELRVTSHSGVSFEVIFPLDI